MDELDRVSQLKSQLGEQVVILGHHYQRDEVVQLADFRGDSLKLVFDAVKCREAKYIVFCGVHFMAETAAILAQAGQSVFLPDLNAGCPLADMADLADVQQVWDQLGEVLDVETQVTPITYVNSTAALKAFCGRHNGLVCTSSNAERILAWAFEQRPYVFFFPDQHLGRNTGKKMGVALEEMLLWDPKLARGGHNADRLRNARIFLWRGWCRVHRVFSTQDVIRWRRMVADIRVIVHPECSMEVVDLADEAGSTSYIIRRIDESPSGSKWAVGTEYNLVHRLDQAHTDKFVAILSEKPVNCRNMNLITLEKVGCVLEGLVDGNFVNQVEVPGETAQDARIALERMLEVSR
jgi:quinolinate synthase